MWAVRYHGPSRSLDGAYAIALDAQGNVYVTGGSGDDSERNHATIKYDADGNEIWVARYPGRGGTALALDVEGNIYVTGVTLYPSYDYLTVKYDSEGTEVWVARHDGERGGARDLAVDSAGNVYSAGAIADDYGTVKYDSKGNEVWVARYHGPGSCCDAVARIAIDGQDNVYVTGRSAGVGRRSDYATIKYDPQGNEVWVARYGGPVDGSDAPWALALDAKGNVYVTGRSYGTATYDAEFATIKYSQQD